MKILSAQQMKELDAFTIENEPIASIDLMERASQACADWISKKYTIENNFKIFCGPGNNGGDGLAIARMLSSLNFHVEVFIIGQLSEDGSTNYNRLIEQNRTKIQWLYFESDFPQIKSSDIIIDALFGYGLSRPLSGIYVTLVSHMNKNKGIIISIDIPSGLSPDDNSENLSVSKDPYGRACYSNIVKADYTLTFDSPFWTFLNPDFEIHIGEWHILDIGLNKDFKSKIDSKKYVIDKYLIKSKLKTRTKYSHKGIYGHGLLISGSYGKMGAAILASKAGLRAGAGLITTHIPIFGYQIIQTAVPENMVSLDDSNEIFSKIPENIESFTALGIGPGIGTEIPTANALKNLLENAKTPMIIDADAINILGMNKEWLGLLPKNCILTPHPKEFERLAGKSGNFFERLDLQVVFSQKFSVYVVFKGANTCITTPNGSTFFNTTGNPGMASAGSGDVLTGIILGLLSQGYSSEDACLIGVYIHGLSGDIASERYTQEAMIAGDIIDCMGEAFKKIKN